MSVFRGLFVRKDSTRGVQPAEARMALAGLLTPSGYLGALAGVISGLTVSGIASTWAYAVSAGHAVTTRSAADGANMPGLDGTTNTPTVAAAPASGSRYDLIWIKQNDVDSSDSDSSAALGVTQGTASGSPTKPYASVPAGALVLAEAQVAAGATGTLHASVVITPVAPRVAARGGVIPVTTQAQLDALNAVATASIPLLVDHNGVIKRSTGSGWANLTQALSSPFTSGYANTSTDINGLVHVTHGLGVTPTSVLITISNGPVGIDILLSARSYQSWWNATTFDVQITRLDTNALLNSNPVSFSWMAIA